MANTILTHQMVAQRAAKRLAESLPFIMNINRQREDDATATVNGYKKGGTLKIKIPPPFKVYDGAVFAGGGAIDAVVESSVTLNINRQKHVGMAFTSMERALSIDEYDERFIQPGVATLASVVAADMMSKAMLQIRNVVGTAGTVPNSAKTYSQARAALDRFLAPDAPRTMLFSEDAAVELADASKALFNPNKAVEEMFLKGYAKSFATFDFFQNVSLPSVTNGNKVAGVLVNGAGQTGSTISFKGLAGADTFKKGQIFTIAGVYAVNPLSGVASSQLRQFVVTADATSAGATLSVSIDPPLKAAAPGATVSALPADGAGVTFMGVASTAYRQNFGFQRDAFAGAFAPLKVVAGCEGHTFDQDGISIRMMTGGDFTNDLENTRLDVLWADPILVYGDHAIRVTE